MSSFMSSLMSIFRSRALPILTLCALVAACAGLPDPRQTAATAAADAELQALYEREWAWRQNEFGQQRNSM